MKCHHVVFGAGRCERDALPGAELCRLHRGFIHNDPSPGSVGHSVQSRELRIADAFTPPDPFSHKV